MTALLRPSLLLLCQRRLIGARGSRAGRRTRVPIHVFGCIPAGYTNSPDCGGTEFIYRTGEFVMFALFLLAPLSLMLLLLLLGRIERRTLDEAAPQLQRSLPPGLE
jgi:hypothetical protein